MITITAVTVVLQNLPVLQRFSFKADQGEKIVLYGESGCGKSTLLKTVIGMHAALEGTISIAGYSLTPENLQRIRKNSFYLPQEVVPYGDETVREYLHYPFELAINRRLAFPTGKMEELFSAMRLPPDLLEKPFYTLSGGERKRIGLMLGLLLNRPFMLLDEPTAGIDAENRSVIAELLFSVPETTVLAVSHDELLISKGSRKVLMKKSDAAGGPHGSA